MPVAALPRRVIVVGAQGNGASVGARMFEGGAPVALQTPDTLSRTVWS